MSILYSQTTNLYKDFAIIHFKSWEIYFGEVFLIYIKYTYLLCAITIYFHVPVKETKTISISVIRSILLSCSCLLLNYVKKLYFDFHSNQRI